MEASFCSVDVILAAVLNLSINVLFSGKFWELDRLLSHLFSQSRRAIILTQMTGMLDMLEWYLDMRHHRYLRLDPLVQVIILLILILS
jgi:SNF2 family DNA or RNA helicase